MSATRAAEARAESLHEQEREPPKIAEDSIESQEQKEKLYLEVLNTIANTVGAPAPGGQVRTKKMPKRENYEEELQVNIKK